MTMRRAVFFDRDGVINPFVQYPVWGPDSPANPEDFRLFEDAAESIRSVRERGFLAILVSNQPGVAKGKYSLATFDAIDERMRTLLTSAGAVLDGAFYCLHHPEATVTGFRRVCGCRKPQPGLLIEAARSLHIDLERSYLIGDKATDVATARAACCMPILLRRDSVPSSLSDHRIDGAIPVVRNLGEALDHIVKGESRHVA